MINSAVFCVAPFNSLLIDKNGELIPCCDFMSDQSSAPPGHISNFHQWWNHDLQHIRDQFIQDKKDSGCLHCDKKEKTTPSLPSRRIYQNLTAIRPLDFYPTQQPNKIEQVEVRFGNYCNLKCVMCGEYASSSIASEYVTNQSKYNKIGVFMASETPANWWDDEQSLTNLKSILANCNRVTFSGGEPLIIPVLLEILDSINTDCNLVLISNLTKVSDTLIKKLSQFKSVSITASCEGIGTHNNYVRFGSKWNVIEENVKKLQQHKNIKISIGHVLQHTSIFSLPALVDWCQQHSLHLVCRVVYENSYPAPDALGINSVHPTDIEKFKTQPCYSNTPGIAEWVNQYNYDIALNQKFHEYVTMLDSIRDTNFNETFKPTYDQQL